jgi:hypothetical protein
MNVSLRFALLSVVTACVPLAATESPTAEGEVFMWISADKDTYVSCGNPMQNCPEQNTAFGTSSQLVAAESELGIRKSYLHFTPPALPEGAVVLEAYVELFHSGKNEDGRTDDLLLPVDLAAAPWSPQTLTYANQPNKELVGSVTQLDLESQAWSSTPDIAGVAEQWLSNPASNNGLVVYWFSTSQDAEKGFFSNNHTSRTATDQGLAPRLLMKVAFADGTSTNDMTLGALPPDNDLDFDGEVLMVQFVSTTDWPADWEVAHAR